MLIAVHVAIAVHIAHWVTSGETISPLEPSEAMEFSKESVVNAGLIFFGLAILSTALFGRFVCGWACHLVAVQDLSRWVLGKFGIHPRPFKSRVLLIVPSIAFAYMFLWPAAYRLYHRIAGHGGVELTTDAFWETFPPWPVALLTIAVCGFWIIYFLGAKGFCTYACPYGAIFGFADRFAPLRIRVDDSCEGCAACTAVCTSNVEVHAEVRDFGAVVDPGCMKCLDCVSVCPNDSLRVGWGRPGILQRRRNKRPPHARGPAIVREKVARWRQLTWGEEALAAALFLGGFAAFRGLYGQVPFLFSLGIGAILAWLGIQTLHVLRRPALALCGLVVRRNGRLTRAGAGFLVFSTLVAAFWVHAALVRWHDVRAAALTERTLRWAEEGALSDGLDTRERATVLAALEHAEALDELAPSALARDGWLVANLARLGWLRGLLGDGEGTRRALERALAIEPERADLRVRLAEALAAAGEGDRARETARRAAEGSLDPTTRARLAGLLAALGEGAAAEAMMRRAVDAHPDDPTAWYDLGVLLSGLQRSAEAVECFELARTLDPDSVPILENLAGALCAVGRFSEGLERFEQALERSPGDAETHALAARAALEFGDLGRAEAHAKAVTTLAADSPVGWILLAEALARGGKGPEAAEARRRAEALGARR